MDFTYSRTMEGIEVYKVVNAHLKGKGDYLEIGIQKGNTFFKVDADVKIAMDIALVFSWAHCLDAIIKAYKEKKLELIFAMTSDEFFWELSKGGLNQYVPKAYDAVFVDGMHEYYHAIRDIKNSLRFLKDGDKTKVTMRFRGREHAHRDLGLDLLKRVEADLSEFGSVEQAPQMEGRQMVMVLGPKKQ